MALGKHPVSNSPAKDDESLIDHLKRCAQVTHGRSVDACQVHATPVMNLMQASTMTVPKSEEQLQKEGFEMLMAHLHAESCDKTKQRMSAS